MTSLENSKPTRRCLDLSYVCLLLCCLTLCVEQELACAAGGNACELLRHRAHFSLGAIGAPADMSQGRHSLLEPDTIRPSCSLYIMQGQAHRKSDYILH